MDKFMRREFDIWWRGNGLKYEEDCKDLAERAFEEGWVCGVSFRIVRSLYKKVKHNNKRKE